MMFEDVILIWLLIIFIKQENRPSDYVKIENFEKSMHHSVV
jgi:hypothetical protein